MDNSDDSEYDLFDYGRLIVINAGINSLQFAVIHSASSQA